MAVQSNDNDLKDLLLQVSRGELQLPEFQRSWVWDDTKIPQEEYPEKGRNGNSTDSIMTRSQ